MTRPRMDSGIRLMHRSLLRSGQCLGVRISKEMDRVGDCGDRVGCKFGN